MPQMGPLMWLPLYIMIFMLLKLTLSVLTSLCFNTTSMKENLILTREPRCLTQWTW